MQRYLLAFNVIVRFIKGCTMALIVANLLQQTNDKVVAEEGPIVT